jgi:hypothetical protein
MARGKSKLAKDKSGKAEEAKGSVAKIQGFLGIVALAAGNVVAILTRIDEIGKHASKLLGPEWAYRLHGYIVYGASALLFIGYASLTYWLYKNFVAQRAQIVKAAFFAAAFVAVLTTVGGTYYFLLKPVDFAPLLKSQLSQHAQTILSQQTIGGDDDGGFRFSQSGASNDVQVWNTAQCLTALLQQEAAIVMEAKPAIRRAFGYMERSRLRSPGDGWGYIKDLNWGVTEIDAWVALAYIYSLRADNAAILWEKEEIADVVGKANLALGLLVKRQHDDGGWSVIEKTPNPKHIRTYSTVMATWALAEAQQNGTVLKGHEAEYQAAVTLGAKWLLRAYASNPSAASGWWPNPSGRSLPGEYPGLTAQALFTLTQAKVANAFIGADPKYKEAIEAFIKFALEGNDSSGSLIAREIANNEQTHDSDRYLEGRPETAEQSKFLWYPWTVAAATSLVRDPILRDYQHDQLKDILSMLLRRSNAKTKFIRDDPAIYPTAETLLAEGYYFSKEPLAAPRK